MNKIILGALLLGASCNIYRSEFDCPAGKGVGCASVGEVLDMIVEREGGEDLFIRDRGRALVLREEEERALQHNHVRHKTLALIQKETGELALEEAQDESVSR